MIIASLLVLIVYLFWPPAPKFILTDGEKAWLKEHPVVRIAPNPNFVPIEFYGEKDTYQGLAADIVRLIEQKTGIKFEIVQCANQEETFKAIQNLKTDIISATAITSQRAEYLNFSQPFIRLQKVIIVHENDMRRMTSDSLNGMRVAIVGNSSVHEEIKKRKINVILDTVSSSLETLYEVSFGRAEAGIMNLATATYLIEAHQLHNLRVAGDFTTKQPYVMAIRKDWPILVEIINKALASIPAEQHEEIVARWIGLKWEKHWYDNISFEAALAVLALIGILYVSILTWNRSLKRQVQEKTNELRLELNERLKTEKALIESEEKFRSIVKLLPEAILIINDKGFVVEVNRAACEMLGYNETSLLGLNVRDFLSEDEIQEHMKKLIDRNEPSGYFEMNMKRKDGSLITAEGTNMEIVLRGVKHYVGVAHDISIRKQAEEKLLESREKLRELNAAKDRFFSIISHDLRSPFWGILSLSDMLVQPENDLTPQEVQKIHNNLNAALKTLFTLLENLLKWSQIQIGRFDIEIDEVDIRLTMHKIIGEIKKAAEQKEIEIKNDVEENLVLRSDENILSSVLRNLLSNAIKFTPRNGKVRISSKSNTDHIFLLIEDNGIGMNPDQQLRLFKIDTVFSMKGTENEKGTGLGLIIVKEMLDKVNGSISVESEIGRGSKFIVKLPHVR